MENNVAFFDSTAPTYFSDTMYRYLFGPVPSRRLGVSLGIDLTPEKSCTFNCVYCECGNTSDWTMQRGEFVPTPEVISELRSYLSENPALDSVTFSGSGEPTLHSGIGDVISFLKDEFPAYRVTVLTNSSLLHIEEVRRALYRADLVIPSLDAISESVFKRLNRPVPGLTAVQLVDGLRRFCTEFDGNIWLEIFLVPGVNDTLSELELFRLTVLTLRCDKIQLNTLDRPGAVSWISPASTKRLEDVARAISDRVEIVASRRFAGTTSETRTNLRDVILSTVQVRPCTLEDLVTVLGMTTEEVESALNDLMSEDLVTTSHGERGLFYFARIGRHTVR